MFRKSLGLVLVVSVILMVLVAMPMLSQERGEFEGYPEYPLPEFPEGLEWVNVEAPLTVEDLRGKVVLFDFWTYGCINCIHMIPVLEALEQKYPDELVVIGVHSAKFENEGETTNIQQIVQRYNLHHPVINDKDFRVWQMFGARAWPTLLLADPRGNIFAMQSGEIPFEPLDQIISGMVEHFDSLGKMNREPIALALEGAGQPSGVLAFPGKVLVDVEGNRLFIADSNNHRIISTDLTTYEVLDVIGSGQRGFDNGSYEEATFYQPQGMALDGTLLYVADVNNHAIRVIDLETRDVDTLIGTGVMGRGISNSEVTDLLNYDMRSPWDVEIGDNDMLYIAMAGTHQIWEFDLAERILRPSVGNGREAMKNDTLADSELAQPSGLYYVDGKLYFADSESSTIRVADYNTDRVDVISGTVDNNLFDFGDVDGPLEDSLLQHALGVTGAPDGTIYIADTYNSKIKQIDADNYTTTLFGLTGNGGYTDGDANMAQFDEPGGLEYAELSDGRAVLFVADTNNHVIRIVDIDAGTVGTVTFPNPEALQIEDNLTVIGRGEDAVTLEEQTVAAGESQITFELIFPEGYKINDLAPSTIEWASDDTSIISVSEMSSVIETPKLQISSTFVEGESTLYGTLTLYYCEAINQSLCFIDIFDFAVPITVSADGGDGVVIERTITPPVIQ